MALYSKAEGSLLFDSRLVDRDELLRIEATLFLAKFLCRYQEASGVEIPELHVNSQGMSPENLVGAEAIKGYLLAEGRISL